MRLLNKAVLLVCLSALLPTSLRAAEPIIESMITTNYADKILSFSGYVEAENSYHKLPGSTSFDFFLSTFELGLDAKLADWLTARGLLLYEEDADNILLVDEAFIRLQQKDSPFFAEAGRFTQSFGKFETGMISDPLTLELGEAKHHASLKAGFEQGFVTASLSIWKGDLQKNAKSDINSLVGALSIADSPIESFKYEIGGSWTNNIGDTDGLQEDFETQAYVTTDFVHGYSFYGIAGFGSIEIRGEYLAAASRFSDGAKVGMKPSAWNFELGYSMEMPLRFAVRYAGAHDFDIKNQYGATVAYNLTQGASLALEYLHHSHDDGRDGDGVTVQLAMQF
ncbi:MAG: LbtU family siderophore porin [Chlorobiales bacterium]|nr:LbtU family siderophore porin [Chlorobiales bacterium]